jgi:CRP-like cAMP-binding protein
LVRFTSGCATESLFVGISNDLLCQPAMGALIARHSDPMILHLTYKGWNPSMDSLFRALDRNRARQKGDGAMIDHAIRKLKARDDLTDVEEVVLRAAASDIVEVAKGMTFVKANAPLTASNILIDGLVCRHRDMANGDRQVTEVHVPGDFVDLHSFPLEQLDHDITALVPSRIAVVPHAAIRTIMQTQPHLTRLLWRATAMDAAIHREWMVSIGRRSALARVAHVLCELYERLKIVGLADGLSYRLPLTQTDLAQCLGLIPIHVNRTLRELRLTELVTFRSKLVSINDLAALQAIAEFTDDYLFLNRRVRSADQ